MCCIHCVDTTTSNILHRAYSKRGQTEIFLAFRVGFEWSEFCDDVWSGGNSVLVFEPAFKHDLLLLCRSRTFCIEAWSSALCHPVGLTHSSVASGRSWKRDESPHLSALFILPYSLCIDEPGNRGATFQNPSNLRSKSVPHQSLKKSIFPC